MLRVLQAHYNQKKAEQWAKYARSGADDPQMRDIVQILRGDGVDI